MDLIHPSWLGRGVLENIGEAPRRGEINIFEQLVI
jgi:hypothetical protein